MEKHVIVVVIGTELEMTAVKLEWLEGHPMKTCRLFVAQLQMNEMDQQQQKQKKEQKKLHKDKLIVKSWYY